MVEDGTNVRCTVCLSGRRSRLIDLAPLLWPDVMEEKDEACVYDRSVIETRKTNVLQPRLAVCAVCPSFR